MSSDASWVLTRLRFLLIASCVALLPKGLEAAAATDIHWSGPVVVVGDIHGDLEALKSILLAHELVDRQTYEWHPKRKTLLILLGDLVGRGWQSKEVMDYVLALQRQSHRRNSRIEVLWGNHEFFLLDGDDRYVDAEDRELQKGGVQKLFREPSRYTAWLKQRPGFLRVHFPNGRTYGFVHAGLGEWVTSPGVTEVNAELERVVTLAEEGKIILRSWAVQTDGPLWSRSLALGKVSEETLKRWMSAAGIHRLVIGHTPTTKFGSRIVRAHPRYGNKVIMADTGISAALNGNLEALTIQGGKLSVKRTLRPLKSCQMALEMRLREESLQTGDR